MFVLRRRSYWGSPHFLCLRCCPKVCLCPLPLLLITSTHPSLSWSFPSFLKVHGPGECFHPIYKPSWPAFCPPRLFLPIIYYLDQKSANLYVKDLAASIVGLVDSLGPVTASHLRQRSTKTAQASVNEWVWSCSNKTLAMDAEMWLSYVFPMSQNILLLIFFRLLQS